jgi:hypothetical protein
MKVMSRIVLAAVFLCGGAALAAAQETKSGPLAKQLIAALEAKKIDSIAAKDPSATDVYFGALYIPGVQLLVVSGGYTAPQLMDGRLARKEYRDVYIELNGASTPATKMLIEDLGADGLKAKREDDAPSDSIDMAGKHTMFDGEWKKQKLSEDEYLKIFSTSDARYAQILNALLAQAK